MKTQEQLDEEGLVRRVQAGDMEAFGQLMEIYRPYIANLCFRLMPYRHIIEDTVSIVMMKIWQKLPDFEWKSCFKTWMHSLTFNMIQDERRHEALWCKRHLTEEGTETLSWYPSRDAMPDVIVDNKDRGQILLWAMSHLNKDQQTVITLYLIDGLDHEQIAEKTGRSAGTIRSRLYYAKLLLQGLLESRGCTPN